MFDALLYYSRKTHYSITVTNFLHRDDYNRLKIKSMSERNGTQVIRLLVNILGITSNGTFSGIHFLDFNEVNYLRNDLDSLFFHSLFAILQ